MDERVLRIFQREVERQSRFALMAAEDLQQSLGTVDMDRIWYSIQALLVAAGDISKLLWPLPSEEPPLPERGPELRASLNVSDDSPLQPRKFRNHFEHFDTRIEEWATSSKRQNFVDSSVASPSMIVGIDPEDYLRNLDPESWEVTFRGDKYAILPIIESIRELWENASSEAAKWP